jgi:hypothetical protein
LASIGLFGVKIADRVPQRIEGFSKPNLRSKKEKELPGDNAIPRFAIGFSSGFSPVRTSVSKVSNGSKLHKDTRGLFDQMNDNQRSTFINIGFDYMLLPKLSLGFSSGLQCREISNTIDLTYKLNEIPFREKNGDIQFYIHVPDSQRPPVISVRSQMTFRFVNVPFRLSYGYVFKGSNELQFSGGLNLSMLAGVKGNTFSVNEVSIKPVSETIEGFFNVGYTGGLMYSRKIYKNWWLGIETQFQRNHLKYDTGYGTLKSKTDIYNFNFNLKYRF